VLKPRSAEHWRAHAGGRAWGSERWAKATLPAMCNLVSAQSGDVACGGKPQHPNTVQPAAQEEDLTRDVPSLLEAMNRAAEDVNDYERKVDEAQLRYKARLEHWSRLYSDLRKQYGSDFDRVKPYFDASQALNATAYRMQNVVYEFSTVASRCTQAKTEIRNMEKQLVASSSKGMPDRDLENSLSRAAARLLHYQQERDWRQEEHESALRVFQEAQEAFAAYGSQLPDSIVRCIFPCFRLLRQHQLRLASEQSRINSLLEGARNAKSAYNNCMRELERISTSVHRARSERAEPEASAPERPATESGAPQGCQVAAEVAVGTAN